jgi:hypothetical protein
VKAAINIKIQNTTEGKEHKKKKHKGGKQGREG